MKISGSLLVALFIFFLFAVYAPVWAMLSIPVLIVFCILFLLLRRR